MSLSLSRRLELLRQSREALCSPLDGTAHARVLHCLRPLAFLIRHRAASRRFDTSKGSCFAAVIFPLLRVDFAVPTDSVSVILGNFSSSDGWLTAFTSVTAFDETGQNIGTCSTNFVGPSSGCSNTIIVGGENSWTRVTFSDPSGGIRFIVTGASSDAVPVGVVQFDSPVSLQLAGLLTKVEGVGRGESLEHKVMHAQAFYSVGDIRATCAMLTGFVNEVEEQSGKHINKLTASQLLATAQAIETAITCHSEDDEDD